MLDVVLVEMGNDEQTGTNKLDGQLSKNVICGYLVGIGGELCG